MKTMILSGILLHTFLSLEQAYGCRLCIDPCTTRSELLLLQLPLGATVSSANQDLPTFDAFKITREMDPKVAAVGDGLKAWEVLKERPRGIDLILTEVELPSNSGHALFTLIMEHETCKNIPVISMIHMKLLHSHSLIWTRIVIVRSSPGSLGYFFVISRLLMLFLVVLISLISYMKPKCELLAFIIVILLIFLSTQMSLLI